MLDSPELDRRIHCLRPGDDPALHAVGDEQVRPAHGQIGTESASNALGLLVTEAAVDDLGRDVAGDSAALSARKDRHPDGTLPQPDGGRKEYTDETGKVVKVYEWFGYKFHLLVERTEKLGFEANDVTREKRILWTRSMRPQEGDPPLSTRCT